MYTRDVQCAPADSLYTIHNVINSARYARQLIVFTLCTMLLIGVCAGMHANIFTYLQYMCAGMHAN